MKFTQTILSHMSYDNLGHIKLVRRCDCSITVTTESYYNVLLYMCNSRHQKSKTRYSANTIFFVSWFEFI